ncbi:MAG: aconitase X, partial [Rhodospirillales bacterium]|nr:aconitase X [Rhodospirillales bacterium]
MGYHLDSQRFGTQLIELECEVETIADWGQLGYFMGGQVEENIPVIDGATSRPDLIRHKHLGAAAASSGGVEMYHLVGATPEADSLEMAFGPNKPVATISYGQVQKRQAYEDLNSN